MSDEEQQGFEFEGRFYRFHFSDIGKDLILVDRIAMLPIQEFVAQVSDAFDSGRSPILLALIATSLRAGNPDWPLERVYRTVMELSLGEVKMVFPQEEMPDPPAEPPAARNGSASSSESKPTSSDPEPEPSETSSATPA